jgi:hypothetical protein
MTVAVMITAVESLPAHASSVPTSAKVAVDEGSTRLATYEDKAKIAELLGIPLDAKLGALSDREFVLAVWRAAPLDSSVKAQALQAYFADSGTQVAYEFIVTGFYTSRANDNLAEIAVAEAKALRRSAAVHVGLDPKDTVLIEKNDRDFIIAVSQRAKEGSHVQKDARLAFREASTQEDWTMFLRTGAQAAAELDLIEEIENADEAEIARRQALQLKSAKLALLHLLQLPATEEASNLPNRQFVLSVKSQAKGAEVLLSATAVIDAIDIEKAAHDFIFTNASLANTRDEKAAAAKELADYKTRVGLILDAAKRDTFQPNLVAATEAVLKAPTLLSLQTYLLKGADAALRTDLTAPRNKMTIQLKSAQSGRCAGTFGVVEGTAEDPKAKTVLLDCKQEPVQRWDLRKQANGSFVLYNVNSRRCLAVLNGGTSTNIAVVQDTCDTALGAQQWMFESVDNGMYRVRNVNSSLMLLHPAGETANNTALVQQAMGGAEATNQQWRVIDVVHTGLNLPQPTTPVLLNQGGRCITGGGNENGSGVQMRPCLLENLGGRWIPTDIGEHTYTLKNSVSGRCLDIKSNDSKPGADVHEWTCNGAPNQQWVFRSTTDGKLKIVSALTNALLSRHLLPPLPPNPTPLQIAGRAAQERARVACSCDPLVVEVDHNGAEQLFQVS